MALPTLRPSLRQALQPEAIEETVVRCVVSHLGLSKSVQGLELLQATETQAEEFSFLCDVMSEVFIRLNALIRQLQTMAEMEKKWAHELDDVRGAILQPSAAFFNDFHLQEVFPYQCSFLTFCQLSWAICFLTGTAVKIRSKPIRFRRFNVKKVNLNRKGGLKCFKMKI